MEFSFLINVVFVILALGAAVALMVLNSNNLLNLLNKLGFKQIIREEGPQAHQAKSNTPTAGGLVFILAYLVAAAVLFVWQNFVAEQVDWALLSKLFLLSGGAMAIGFADDYLKKVKKHNEGLKPKQKLFAQIVLSLLTAFLCQRVSTNVFNLDLNLGFFGFFIFTFLVLAGSMNAANLTDGLDGLAASVISCSFLGLGVLCFNKSFEIAILCFSLAGICLGFLKVNAHPAKVFMGDTGSFFLGACFGLFAIFAELEWSLLLVALVPIWETLSVIIQVVSCKFSKRYLKKDIRPFRMTPFHHHLELSGMHETKVVGVLAIAQAFCSILAVLVFYFFKL